MVESNLVGVDRESIGPIPKAWLLAKACSGSFGIKLGGLHTDQLDLIAPPALMFVLKDEDSVHVTV